MGPFVRSKDNKNKMMIRIFIALIPLLLFSFYKNGFVPFIEDKIGILGLFYPLIFIFVGMLSSFIFELIYAFILKKDEYKDYIKESYNIFSGLFLSIILPNNTPIYILVLAIFIAVTCKMIFDKIDNNIFNTTLIGYLVVSFIFSSSISNSIFYEHELIKTYEGLFDFFIGINGAIITSSLLCLLGFIYLIITKTIKWKITISYIITVFISTYAIGSYLDQSLYYPLFNILNGGLIFGSIYLATDFNTSSVTPIGQVLQGIFTGIVTVFFRYIGFEGVAISILIINIFVPLFDKIGSKSRFNFIKSFGMFLIAWILIIALCLYFSLTNKTKALDSKIIKNVSICDIRRL